MSKAIEEVASDFTGRVISRAPSLLYNSLPTHAAQAQVQREQQSLETAHMLLNDELHKRCPARAIDDDDGDEHQLDCIARTLL